MAIAEQIQLQAIYLDTTKLLSKDEKKYCYVPCQISCRKEYLLFVSNPLKLMVSQVLHHRSWGLKPIRSTDHRTMRIILPNMWSREGCGDNLGLVMHVNDVHVYIRNMPGGVTLGSYLYNTW